MDSKQKIVRVIETTRGQAKSQELIPRISTILFHQKLSPVTFAKPCNIPITLESHRYHLDNPQSLQNTSLTPGLIEHEVQTLVQLKKCSHGQVLIMDGSDYQTRVNELFDKYVIVKGYNYRIEGNSQEVLYSFEHILKQTEYQFKLGNGKYKPGFIGEITLSSLEQNQRYSNAMRAYLTFSATYKCPVLVKCSRQTQGFAGVLYEQMDEQTKRGKCQTVEACFKNVQNLLQTAKNHKVSRLVIFNLPLLFVKRFNYEQCAQEIICLHQHKIVELFDKYEAFFGFDLNRYTHHQFSRDYLALLVKKYPHKILLSSGLQYKADLTTFGGDGCRFQSQNSSLFKRFSQVVIDPKIIEQVVFKNQMTLLDWKERFEEVQIITMWQCDGCGLSLSEKVQSFKKFGKMFCSIKCLKSYKF